MHNSFAKGNTLLCGLGLLFLLKYNEYSWFKKISSCQSKCDNKCSDYFSPLNVNIRSISKNVKSFLHCFEDTKFTLLSLTEHGYTKIMFHSLIDMVIFLRAFWKQQLFPFIRLDCSVFNNLMYVFNNLPNIQL